MKPALPLLVTALLCSGCSSIPLEHRAPPVSALPHNKTDQFTLGRELYLGKCAKCHVAEPVQNYTELEWVEEIMPPMTKKTKLNAYESDAVLAYVLAARRIPLPPDLE